MEGGGDKNQWPASAFTSHLAISGQCQRQRLLGKHVLRLTTTEVLCGIYSVSILCVIGALSLTLHALQDPQTQNYLVFSFGLATLQKGPSVC